MLTVNFDQRFIVPIMCIPFPSFQGYTSGKSLVPMHVTTIKYIGFTQTKAEKWKLLVNKDSMLRQASSKCYQHIQPVDEQKNDKHNYNCNYLLYDLGTYINLHM